MNLHLSQPKPGAECVEPMICLNDDDTDAISHVTELPKDGTPCDDPSSNKGVWAMKTGRCDTLAEVPTLLNKGTRISLMLPRHQTITDEIKYETSSNTWNKNYINYIDVIRNYFNYRSNLPNSLSSKLINIDFGNDVVAHTADKHLPLTTHVDIELKLTPKKIISSRFELCKNENFRQCKYKWPYRSYDGSCNNFENPTWGMAQTRYTRLLPAIYSDGIWTPAVASSGHELPPARLLSYHLFPELRIKDPIWTLLTMQWGQIVTHDMAQLATAPNFNLPSTSCCDENGQLSKQNLNNPECFPIVIGNNDPIYDRHITQCLTFSRATTDYQVANCRLAAVSDSNQSAEQITMVTQFLDLSNIYGSSERAANILRTQSGGRLRTQILNHREFLPPVFIMNSSTFACDEDRPEQVCYGAGDDRVNQNPQLTLLQTMLVREHNRIAIILGHINPHWFDETIYQETRRIMIAQHQFITYYEWLPIIIGVQNAFDYKLIYHTDDIDYIDDYNSNINPTVLNEHSNGAFRVLHSLVAGYLKLVDEKRSPSSHKFLRLSDWFLRPSIIAKADNLDDLTRGLADQPEQTRDEFYDHEITEFLFRGRNRLGGDLRSIDIQRGRDHGIATYNDYREFCGLRRARNWADFSDYISPNNIEKLSRLYEQPDDVDLSVGGSLEINAGGALTGPTFLCILIEQFYRTRVGDRFWFETPNSVAAFTQEQLSEIRKATIARFLCDNSDNIRTMQRRAFEKPSINNPIVKCADLPSINLSLWKDYTLELPGQQSKQHFSILYKK
ncbi:hypothetical protein PV326_010089 [Microctonus aethiopoides]|nr:hypothetical protein PV326_010089 [Microctonus aethiopoides]